MLTFFRTDNNLFEKLVVILVQLHGKMLRLKPWMTAKKRCAFQNCCYGVYFPGKACQHLLITSDTHHKLHQQFQLFYTAGTLECFKVKMPWQVGAVIDVGLVILSSSNYITQKVSSQICKFVMKMWGLSEEGQMRHYNIGQYIFVVYKRLDLGESQFE